MRPGMRHNLVKTSVGPPSPTFFRLLAALAGLGGPALQRFAALGGPALLRFAALGAPALLVLLSVGGCREQPASEAEVLRGTAERGPLKFVVEARPGTVQVGDAVTVNLIVEAPEGYQMRLPTEEAFGELAAREVEAPDPQPGAAGVVWRRTFVIEPLVSGTLEIPSLVATYVRRAAQADTQPAVGSELVTEPLKLEVLSALTAEDKPSEPRDITGTLLPPRPPLEAWQWALIVLGVAAGLALGSAAFWLVRRRLMRPPPPILPEVWALRALAELEAGDWFNPDGTRAYYYRLTEIVRSYVEKKFGLAAPEMTTEEFLATLGRDRRALPYDADRLRAFLEACDFVKYAALSPRREDAQNTLATARAFVQATAAAASSVGPPSPTTHDRQDADATHRQDADATRSSSAGPPSPTSSDPTGGQPA